MTNKSEKLDFLSRCNNIFTCPACGNNSSQCTKVPFHTYRGGSVWYRCLVCGSFFDSEAYDKEKEALHTRLNTTYGEPVLGKDLNEFKMRMYRCVLTLLKRYCPPPAVLLDAGCSFGGFLTIARKAGYEVHGFDILSHAVEYVRSLEIDCEVSYSINDVKRVGDSALDIVSCLDCNCYWPNQPHELHNVFAKLKPGGYLAMRVSDKSWMCALGLIIHRIAPKLGKKILMTAVNDHRFSMPVRSLLNVLHSCGFEVVYASPIGAVHSHKARWSVKLAFVVGSFAWRTTRIFIAPGALILARKPVR